MKHPEHWPLAIDEVRFVGDGVAVVRRRERRQAARTRPKPSSSTTTSCRSSSTSRTPRPTRTLVHADLGTNTSYTWALIPDPTAVDARVRERRAHGEGALPPAAADPDGDGTARRVRDPRAVRRRLHDLLVDADPAHPQDLHGDRHRASPSTSCASSRPRSAARSARSSNVYAEEALCLALAKRLGRPVRWTEERSENTTRDRPGPRHDPGHRARGRRRRQDHRGARATCSPTWARTCSSSRPASRCSARSSTTACYDIPAYSFTCTGVFTNRTPTDAYRGAGRPEATYAIERAIEALAAQVGVDPVEIRRRNFIPTDQFPYTSAAGLMFDSGDYEGRARHGARARRLRRACARSRPTGATRAPRSTSGSASRSYVEMCGLAPSRVLASLRYVGGRLGGRDRARAADRQGAGRHRHLAARPGPRDRVVDDRRRRSSASPSRTSTCCTPTPRSRRSASTPTARVRSSVGGDRGRPRDCDKVLDKARAIAAHQLESSRGRPRVRRRRVPREGHTGARRWRWARSRSRRSPRTTSPTAWSRTSKRKVDVGPAELHVPVRRAHRGRRDRRGDRPRRPARYVAVDDCGNQVNPLIVEGQIHGGVVQGIAQALWEEAVYDDDGNLLNASLARLPRAVGRGVAELSSSTRPSRRARPTRSA